MNREFRMPKLQGKMHQQRSPPLRGPILARRGCMSARLSKPIKFATLMYYFKVLLGNP